MKLSKPICVLYGFITVRLLQNQFLNSCFIANRVHFQLNAENTLKMQMLENYVDLQNSILSDALPVELQPYFKLQWIFPICAAELQGNMYK